MSKEKILRVLLPATAATLAIVAVCVLCILFLTRCQHGVKDPTSDPDSSSPSSVPAMADDVKISDREDFDWRSEAGNTPGKDESFNNIQPDSTPGGDANTSQGEEGDIGLRHDESKNQGQEADYSTWDMVQP